FVPLPLGPSLPVLHPVWSALERVKLMSRADCGQRTGHGLTLSPQLIRGCMNQKHRRYVATHMTDGRVTTQQRGGRGIDRGDAEETGWQRSRGQRRGERKENVDAVKTQHGG